METPEPTEDELAFWREVFETHRKIMGTASKPKTDKQLVKWLQNPHSDSAEYKMWGNGVPSPMFTLSFPALCTTHNSRTFYCEVFYSGFTCYFFRLE